MRATIALASFLAAAGAFAADAAPPDEPAGLAQIADPVDATELHATIEKLVGFGTRHTLSDTKSTRRGIGAARRWVQSRFEQFSKDCGGCLEVVTPSQTVTGKRVPQPTEVTDVVAILRGTSDPDRAIVITGHLDSRVIDVMDAKKDA
ncbi:MAG TPA: peptidase M28, partial [Casimicrobiaceae bacterium]